MTALGIAVQKHNSIKWDETEMKIDTKNLTLPNCVS